MNIAAGRNKPAGGGCDDANNNAWNKAMKQAAPLPYRLLHQAAGCGSQIPLVRDVLILVHGMRHRGAPLMRPHPFDRVYGTRTNGSLPPWLLRSGHAADAHVTAYAGCQPSCARRALSVIPQPERFSFVDIGCGKGRALIIASEWPFRRIVGVELAPALVNTARRNARIIHQRYPERTALEVVQGDATAVPLPNGNLVILLFHAFDAALVAKLLAHILTTASGSDREVFLIFENPVYGEMVDASRRFSRYFAETVPCGADEIGYGPHDDETVIIWRLVNHPLPASPHDANRPIIIENPGMRATLG
jgi:SAM-dependent methyltransferase